MATVSQQLAPAAATQPAASPATFDVIAGTNFPVPCLDFDAVADETAFWVWRAINYGAGDLTLHLDWYADTASSGDVVWTGAIAAITPDTDSQDIETKAFATAGTVTDSHLGTTGQRLHRAVITISNLDSLAAGDWCILRVTRDADNAADTMSGDACLVGATLSYSDT